MKQGWSFNNAVHNPQSYCRLYSEASLKPQTWNMTVLVAQMFPSNPSYNCTKHVYASSAAAGHTLDATHCYLIQCTHLAAVETCPYCSDLGLSLGEAKHNNHKIIYAITLTITSDTAAML